MWLKKAPFLRVLPAFMLGIWLQQGPGLPHNLLWISLPFTFIMVLWLRSVSFYRRFRSSWLNGLFIQVIFFSAGALFLYYQDIRNDPQWQGNIYQPGDKALISILDQSVERKKSMKATGKFISIIRNGRQIPVKGKLLVYYEKNISLKPGDRILLTKPIEKIQNPGNPGEFDQARYCLFRGITGRVYLKKEEFQFVDHNSPGFFSRELISYRENIIAALKKYIPGEQQSGLAEALLIGYKEDIDPELAGAYANTGTVHIIAISGMHLGLIYGILLFLLKPLPANRQANWIRTLILFSTLWLFSFLCGAQASILRSTIMFSFILIGQRAGRRTSVINSLAASAFLLLCIDPFWLWDPGFQLSYAAITGILLFYRHINNWYYSENKLVSGIWSLMAVSIAAQVLTFPISVYHFHQFPLLFIFSNLLAVPLSGIILTGEIILYTVSFIPAIAVPAGKLISLMITVMNNFIRHVDSVPCSTVKGIEVGPWQVLLLYLTIYFFWCFTTIRKPIFLKWGLLATIVFLSIRLISFQEAETQQKIIIYSFTSGSAIDIVSGRTAWFIGDKDPALERQVYRTRSLIRISRVLSLPDSNLFFINGRRILLADGLAGIDSSHPVDLLLIRGKEKFIPPDTSVALNISRVVLDASLPVKKAMLLEKYCLSLKIPTHNIRKEGAFVMNMR